MAAALVRGQRVNLVDDHCPGGRKHFAARFRSEQDVKRFRSCDYDMGGPATHALALSCGRIAGAHPGADINIGKALLTQRRTDARQRSFEIFADVVRQRLQWGNVDDLGLVTQRAVKSLAHEIVDCRHEGSQCFAGTGRGGNEHIAPSLDGGPRLRLRGRRPTETTVEPGGDGGMEQRERNSWTGTVPHSFAGKRPKVRNEARGVMWISSQRYGID